MSSSRGARPVGRGVVTSPWPLTLAFFLASTPLAAATYQVGPGRTNTTLTQLFANVDLGPGDLVEVDGDVTYTGGIVMPSPDGGAAGNPVTIRGLRVAN